MIMRQLDLDQLLQKFVGEDNNRPIFQKPWRKDGYVCATDTRILIRVNGALIDTQYPEGPYALSKIFPNCSTQIGCVTLEQLKTALSKCPLVDQTKTIDHDIECCECHGEGEVYWEYEHYSRKFECPVCDGEGYIEREKVVPTGEKEIDYDAIVCIGYRYYKGYYLDYIRNAMEKLGIKTAEILIGNNKVGTQFRLNHDIDILLAECAPGPFHTVYEIKI